MAGNRLTRVPFEDMRALPKLRYLNLQDNAIEAVPTNWRTVQKMNMSQLMSANGQPLFTSHDDVYESYIQANAGSTTLVGDPCLTMLGGNPIVTSSSTSQYPGTGDVVFEVSTSDHNMSSLLVVASKTCAAGCSSYVWAPGKVRSRLGDGGCSRMCNVSICDYDGGDCV